MECTKQINESYSGYPDVRSVFFIRRHKDRCQL